ncbi:hypothetical protein CTKA_00654 [Chthonomonas calidirosea]|uniref:Uncharacterized protein n=1 Tax=Chthonomonas calidirosea (strain DSM 23976 / ICMP 18418 / T49) TaxID=1303518 RepID=S0ESN1_CHTCT|nr:hypothetical protein [Chthonomonas calidirosea]CCW34336.1 hypothetical protein CCALI_00502 [Chthonomonas calidirosea T49]CEK15068.1 hypothetical protein CTKA_00654 [Chthonomonas calidirosea]
MAAVTEKRPAKIIPVDVQRRGRGLIVFIVILLIIAGVVQHKAVDPYRKQLDKTERNEALALGGLNSEFLLLPLLGFREAAAGLLWVRCDEFFHSGDYDAILPLVRIITWLDPHAANVYVTGAWHMAYNFTDSTGERSDRRYIAPSEALLNEGIRNNPRIYDVKFEKGWENFDKIKNYAIAAEAFQDAINTPANKEVDSDDYPYGAPLKVWHILAHTYERMGRIPDAIAVWDQAIQISTQRLKQRGGRTKDFADFELHQAELHNRAEDYQRYFDRYTSINHDHVNTSPYPGVEWPFGGSSKPGPWDVSFSATVTVKRPKVLDIKGYFNAADGARIDVLLEDWDYKPHIVNNTTTAFAVDPNQTIMMDSIAVRKAEFEREIDMSKDPKMYSFAHEYYRLVLSYDPRTTAPHLQDRFGWSGEGMTDSNAAHVVVDNTPEMLGTKMIDGFGGTGPNWDGKTIPVWDGHTPPRDVYPPSQPRRLIMITYKLSRDQILGLKPITDKDIVPNQIMPLGPGQEP